MGSNWPGNYQVDVLAAFPSQLKEEQDTLSCLSLVWMREGRRGFSGILVNLIAGLSVHQIFYERLLQHL